MGVRFPSVASTAILNSPIITTAETVIVTTPALNLPFDGAQVLLFIYCVITLTAGTSAFTPRLRRGTTTGGTLINVAQAITVTASTTFEYSSWYPDSPGVVAEQQWSLTMTMTAAGANSTVQDVALVAMCL